MPSIGDLVAFLRLDTSDFDKKKNSWSKDIEYFNKLSKGISLEHMAKAGLMVSAAINAADVGTKALKGDITDVAAAIKALPLGIGQMAQALESVLGQWTGISAEIEKQNALAKESAEWASTSAKFHETRAKAVRESAKSLQDINDEEKMIGLKAPASSMEQERQKHRDRMAAITTAERENEAKLSAAAAARQAVGVTVSQADVEAFGKSKGLLGNPRYIDVKPAPWYTLGMGGSGKINPRSDLPYDQVEKLAQEDKRRRQREQADRDLAAARKESTNLDAQRSAEGRRFRKQSWEYQKENIGNAAGAMGQRASGYVDAIKDIGARIAGSGTVRSLLPKDTRTNWEKLTDERKRLMAEADKLGIGKAVASGAGQAAQLQAGAFSLAGAAMATRPSQRQKVELEGMAIELLRQLVAEARKNKPAEAS